MAWRHGIYNDHDDEDQWVHVSSARRDIGARIQIHRSL